MQGKWKDALSQLRETPKLTRGLGDRSGEAVALNAIARVRMEQGQALGAYTL
jgi:hypothetical protein